LARGAVRNPSGAGPHTGHRLRIKPCATWKRDLQREGFENVRRLERQVQAESLVDLEHERNRHRAKPFSDTFNGHRPHLFGVRFGVLAQPARLRRQENLKRVHPCDVRGHGHHCDHPASESSSGGVGPVVGDDDCWSRTCGFSSQCPAKLDQADLASDHQDRPSPTAESQTSESPESAHSLQASAYASPSFDERSILTAVWTTAERDLYPWLVA